MYSKGISSLKMDVQNLAIGQSRMTAALFVCLTKSRQNMCVSPLTCHAVGLAQTNCADFFLTFLALLRTVYSYQQQIQLLSKRLSKIFERILTTNNQDSIPETDQIMGYQQVVHSGIFDNCQYNFDCQKKACHFGAYFKI